ncbi:MAG: ABC transporter, ATP-binding/permease protein [Candidatus Levybacteria bacterium GW2011_GWA1_37_16]|nr:MAG: ABC transporter, ATP-binding/permease protein [Candidatus Levybacteria bacterium GW2011_GWA1_37_16]KKQ42896.1 MAG: ABC transporter, ATP-binding/permease protein [Candidatus Levybacteria bacterium GW2011_GWB1_37_8]
MKLSQRAIVGFSDTIEDMKIQAGFQQFKHVLSNLRKMLALAWQMNKKVTFGYYFTAMLGALAPLIASLTLKYLIDNLIGANGGITTIPLIIIAVLAARYILNLAENIIQWGLNATYFDYLFRYTIQNELNRKFYDKLSNLDIAHLEDATTQNLISKTRDTMTWRPPDFLRMFAYLFSSLISYIAAFIVLLPFGWWIPVIITIITLPRLYLRAKYGTIQWSIYGSGAPQVRKIWYLTWLLAMPEAIREMRIFQTQKTLLTKLKETQQYLLNLNKKPLDNYLKQLAYPPILETTVLFIIAYSQLPHVLAGIISIGSFTLLINMIDQLNGSAANAVTNFGEMYEHNLYIDHYFEVLNLPKLITESSHPVVFEKITPPKIEFRNVSFHYKGGKDVLRNISFTINSRESVALVGVNGAGKSTLIKLICRFYDATDGEILINGINIKELKLSNWYKHMGTLFQDFVHYYLTVKDNIILGDPTKQDEKQIIEAAKKAGAYEFIEKLPHKFDQTLGREYEGGEELSIGQWQKLAIARAFYQSSPLLILDEPTSAIDAEAEYEIFNNIEKEYKNKTLILVSHRFSTVRNANKIFVIENGEIIERGTHEQLIEKKGKYAHMFNTQAEGYK